MQEIKDVLGENFSRITVEDIGKLTYLDMCVKDVLRLAPIAPYILRRTIEDSCVGKTDKLFTARQCNVYIYTYL